MKHIPESDGYDSICIGLRLFAAGGGRLAIRSNSNVLVLPIHSLEVGEANAEADLIA